MKLCIKKKQYKIHNMLDVIIFIVYVEQKHMNILV